MEEENKVVQEAEVIEETETITLEIVDPKAEITTVGKITSNIEKVKNQALAMKETYSKTIVTDENLNDAKDLKANINKAKDKVSTYRKNIVAEFKKPIEAFEKLAKETEALLKETYEIVNNQCNAFDDRKKDEAKETLKGYFDEYKASKNLGFTQYADMNQSVGLSDISEKGTIAKKKYKEIEDFIDAIIRDVDTISTMDNAEEILAEYMKDRDLARSIKDVQDRHRMIDTISQSKSDLLQVNEVKVVEPVEVEVLKAPVAQIDTTEEELCEAVFKVITTYDNLSKLVNFMKEEGIKYESIEQ